MMFSISFYTVKLTRLLQAHVYCSARALLCNTKLLTIPTLVPKSKPRSQINMKYSKTKKLDNREIHFRISGKITTGNVLAGGQEVQ